MNLKHLLESYKYNMINVELQEINRKSNESFGVLKFNDDISSVFYLEPKEEYVKSIQIISAATPSKDLTLSNQLKHTEKLLEIIIKTIQILTYLNEQEIKIILNSLGLFDGSFIEKKQLKHDKYYFKIAVIDNLLMLTIAIEE